MTLRKLALQPILPLLVFSIILATLTVSCSVAIKDETLYVDEGPSGAVQANFLTTGQTDLTKDQWDAIREGMVCMPASAFGDFKSEIEQLCTLTTCDYATEQAIMNGLKKIQNIGNLR